MNQSQSRVPSLQRFAEIHRNLLTIQSEFLELMGVQDPEVSSLEELLTPPDESDPKTKELYARILTCITKPVDRFRRTPGPTPIRSIADLLMWRRSELKQIDHFGDNLLKLLEKILNKHNLKIGAFADCRQASTTKTA